MSLRALHRSPSRMRALLPRTAPRSEHDPDLEAAAAANLSVHHITLDATPVAPKELTASLSMHPVTGAFEEPSHEAVFAAQLYRQAYLGQLLLAAILLVHLIGMALTPPAPRAVSSVVALSVAVFLVGRVMLHHQQDQERAQRIGAWSWTASLAAISAFIGVLLVDPDFACLGDHGEHFIPFVAFGHSIVNGSHGMAFAHKTALIVLIPVRSLLVIGLCNNYFAIELSAIGMQILGYVIAHAVEMRLRRSYAHKLCTDLLLRDEDKRLLAEEKRRLEATEQLQAEKDRRLEEEKRLVEERNEQLLAEKERLLYDLLRRGHPVDDDSRSAIRRGLQAGPSRVSTPYQTSGDSSEAEGPVPSASPPLSLPPGPPSSVSSGYTAHTATRAKDGRQRLESSGEALAARRPVSLPPGPPSSAGRRSSESAGRRSSESAGRRSSECTFAEASGSLTGFSLSRGVQEQVHRLCPCPNLRPNSILT